MPASLMIQESVITVGQTASYAALPAIGVNSTERAFAYAFSFSDLLMRSCQAFSTLATTSGGTPLGITMPNAVSTEGSFLTQLVIGGMVPNPSISSGLAPTTASGRRRLPLIISACSLASCVVTCVSPATVAMTAGLPPSYVTWRYFTPVALTIASAAIWPLEVLPAVAIVTWPGFAFIASRSCWKSL